MPELHIDLELPTIYDDCQTFYETIQNTIIAERNARQLSINNMISIIDIKAQLFLQHYNYKPLNYEDCMNPDHPFNNFLQVFAVTIENCQLTVVKDILRISAATLIKNTISHYPEMQLAKELETVERLFLEKYGIPYIMNDD